MSEEADASRRAAELMSRASDAGARGELQEALRLADEAISVAVRAGMDDAQLRMLRELLLLDAQGGRDRDFSGLIEATKHAVAFYAQRKDVRAQIDALINLAGVLIHAGDIQQAWCYVREVEDLLRSVTPADISRNLPEGARLTGELFLRLRRSQLERIKAYLDTCV